MEARFGHTQDIEWCLVADGFQIVPEAADHHPVPDPRDQRSREPRLHLRRSSADDDRPDKAPGTLLLADDDPPADGRGWREAVRRRHPGTGGAPESRGPA